MANKYFMSVEIKNSNFDSKHLSKLSKTNAINQSFVDSAQLSGLRFM
ncbi:hypothetical protein [Facklamia sp. P12950]